MGKIKVARNEKRKNYMGFRIPKIMANFDSINLLFLKSDTLHFKRYSNDFLMVRVHLRSIIV